MSSAKRVLLGLNVPQLTEVARGLGMPSFTGRQIADWLYTKHVDSIDQMTNLSKANRERLAAVCEVGRMGYVERQESKDGTVKYLFPVRCDDSVPQPSTLSPQTSTLSPQPSTLSPQTSALSLQTSRFVETVFIPDDDRGTLCVSCQVGCRMNCLFCQTGKQEFHGHLSVGDIINQVASLPERDRLTNIVFMGQGEPMDNLDSVLGATELLTAPTGYAWSPRRITVSSVGMRKGLKRFLDESECHVAISMHAPSHELRRRLMPAEAAMSISEVVELLRQYDFSHQRRCSFEYICFAGLNDTMTHAREIVNLVKGLDCRVNLIRFHAIPDVDLPGSDEQRMEQLRDYLTAHGVFTTIRASRGQDILAACGLLSTAKRSKN